MTVLSLARGYRRFIIGRLATIAALALALVAAFVLDVATGPSGLRLADLLTAEHDSTLAVILWDIRLPQAVTAVLVGAALALAGAEMQTTLNNALASPFTLGVTNAATLGAASALCLPLSLRQVWAMTTLRGGEDHARSFGIQVERLRLVVLVRVSLLAAVAVSFVGTIGFIGLVGPHLARLTLGEDHRFYLPGAALAGALVMSLASTASKAIVPGLVLPVGIVTALVGIPLFMALLLGGVAHLARRQGAIALIAIHDINLAARFCTRLVILGQAGIIADGSPGQALSPAILHRAYGILGRVESCSLGFPMVLADSAAERSFP